jgi:serine protease Do
VSDATTEALSELAEVAERLRAVTVAVRGTHGTQGSGVLWRPGLVVTNAHVVTGRSVVLEGTTVVEAPVVARDARRDLAVASVPIDFGTGAQIAPGDPPVGALVVALGNPLGWRGAMSAGIVHGREPKTGFILADVQLFPGNSGGPLADVLRRVVGVNTMMLRGLAAAIPVDAVERFLTRG